ncbi:MAG: transcriptional repressor NrdR [Deltaproteobacteria bacterium]|nr:transcriptional repressor NrdR [Deltaproteobacteria bacterium]
MKCPFCSHPESSVIDSRTSKDNLSIRRRRVCDECGNRFTTYERVEEAVPLVAKKDGRLEAFDRSKILNGVIKACEKRPVTLNQIEKLVERVEHRVQDSGDKEIKSSQIGQEIMKELHELDQVAYVRFASVYRQFKDINEFMDELKDLIEKDKQKRVKQQQEFRGVLSSEKMGGQGRLF